MAASGLKGRSVQICGDPNDQASWVKQAQNRAHMRGAGWKDEDFLKPVVTVAVPYSNALECNNHLRELADIVVEEIERQGGKANTAYTPVISDGISQGTPSFASPRAALHRAAPRRAAPRRTALCRIITPRRAIPRRAPAYTHACTRVYKHVYTHVSTHVCAQARRASSTHWSRATHVYTHAYTHAYTHTYTHVYIYTCLHTCLYTCPYMSIPQARRACGTRWSRATGSPIASRSCTRATSPTEPPIPSFFSVDAES